MCSEEKLVLTVGKCTVDAGKLNNQVGVRHFEIGYEIYYPPVVMIDVCLSLEMGRQISTHSDPQS